MAQYWLLYQVAHEVLRWEHYLGSMALKEVTEDGNPLTFRGLLEQVYKFEPCPLGPGIKLETLTPDSNICTDILYVHDLF